MFDTLPLLIGLLVATEPRPAVGCFRVPNTVPGFVSRPPFPGYRPPAVRLPGYLARSPAASPPPPPHRESLPAEAPRAIRAWWYEGAVMERAAPLELPTGGSSYLGGSVIAPTRPIREP